MRRRWDAKKTIGITGLVDILGWDYGMEDPIEDPHLYTALNLFYTKVLALGFSGRSTFFFTFSGT